MNGRKRAAIAAAAGLVVGSAVTWGVMTVTQFEEPRPAGESAALPAQTPPRPPMDDVDMVVAQVAERYKDTPGVHGVGRGFGTPDRDAVMIFVEDPSMGKSLPDEIDGYPVVFEVVRGGFSTDW